VEGPDLPGNRLTGETISNTDQTMIAVVDDDLELDSLIGEYLFSQGLDCELFESGERFLESDYPSTAFLVLYVGLPGNMDSRLINDEVRVALEGLHQIAANPNQTPFQLAISWVLR